MKFRFSSHLALFAMLNSLLVVMSGCASTPQKMPVVGMASHSETPVEWRPSANYDERRPNYVIIHHTSNDNVEAALNTLTLAAQDSSRSVSAHYLISRDGKIMQLVDERHRAWHAGASQWGNSTDINSASIGIELDNNGEEPFAEPQITALLALLRDISTRYSIPTANYLAHADVAPKRKTDPSRYFPWQRLAQEGFGLWCNEPLPELTNGFDAKLNLAALGFNTSDLNAAIQAFKLHFVQDDALPVLNERDQRVMSCLVQMKLS